MVAEVAEKVGEGGPGRCPVLAGTPVDIDNEDFSREFMGDTSVWRSLGVEHCANDTESEPWGP